MRYLTLIALWVGITGQLFAGVSDATTKTLRQALDEERQAVVLYEAVMKKFGQRLPFKNVVRSEQAHVNALLALFKTHGIEVPPNRWTNATFTLPDTFEQACRMAADFEKMDGDSYSAWLKIVVEDDVRAVYTNLGNASIQRHMPAFNRHAGNVATAPKPVATFGTVATADAPAAADVAPQGQGQNRYGQQGKGRGRGQAMAGQGRGRGMGGQGKGQAMAPAAQGAKACAAAGTESAACGATTCPAQQAQSAAPCGKTCPAQAEAKTPACGKTCPAQKQ